MNSQRHIYDVSILVHPGLPTYPGDPGIDIRQEASQAEGDGANVSKVCFGVHSGTHIDSPYHVDATWSPFPVSDLSPLIGPARVVEVAGDEITAAGLASLDWEGVERVLFKTRNSSLWNGEFRDDYVALAPDGAEFLIDQTKVRLVGIDYLSIEPFGNQNMAVHRRLLGKGVLVVEGLYLAEVAPGDYELLCLPMKLNTPDGGPVRALLRDL